MKEVRRNVLLNPGPATTTDSGPRHPPFTSTSTGPGIAEQVLLQWSGTCGVEDDRSFHVKVYPYGGPTAGVLQPLDLPRVAVALYPPSVIG